MAKKKQSEITNNQKIAAGVGLTAAAVAAAGAYFLYGSKDADKNRKTVKSWALKAKADVLEKLEDAKNMSQDEYEKVVHSVADAYSGAKGATKTDLKSFTSEMKDYWTAIESSAKPAAKAAAIALASELARKGTKKAMKAAKKPAAKKAVKKAAKKATKATKKSTKK